MLRRRLRTARLADERGFTLVEMLVGMLIGIVVVGATYAILQTTLLESSRVFSRVDATQRSRLAMENIESLLHSSCVTEGVTPIYSNTTASVGPILQSNGSQLNFVSRYGGAANPTPVLHSIALSSGNLTDTTYNVSGGSAPAWTYSTTPASTNSLLTNVAQSGTKPVFQYFGYTQALDSSGNAYQDDSGNPFQMLLDGTTSLPSGSYTSSGTPVAMGTVPANSPAPLAVPLSSADANTATEVLITMKVGPGRGQGLNTNLSDVGITVSNAVVLRLTAVVSDGSDNQEVSPCS